MYRIKPKVERTYSQLTAVERAEIARRTQSGEKQVALAIEFRCSDRSIRRACKEAGVTRWAKVTPALEREAVRLMREGLQQEKTARRLRLPGTVVHELYLKHKIDPHRGGRLAPRKLAKVIAAVRAGKKYCNQIARENGVAVRTALKYAHAVRGDGRFIPGSRVPPLQSLYNSNSDAAVERGYRKFLETAFRRTVSLEASPMRYAAIWREFLEGYIERKYGGVLPPDRTALLSEVLNLCYLPEVLKLMNSSFPDGMPDISPAKREIAGYLEMAVESIASKQDVVH
jgi:hypothetical protein